MGLAVIKSRPDSEQVTDALGHIMRQAGVIPKYLIVDYPFSPVRSQGRKRCGANAQEHVMLTTQARQVADAAMFIYTKQHRITLQNGHLNKCVFVAPEPAEFLVRSTLDEIANQARPASPSCLTYTVRIGYEAALHLGAVRQ